MWLILLLLWMFDVITFKSVLLCWATWVAINIICFVAAGAIYYNFLVAPILEMLS